MPKETVLTEKEKKNNSTTTGSQVKKNLLIYILMYKYNQETKIFIKVQKFKQLLNIMHN